MTENGQRKFRAVGKRLVALMLPDEEVKVGGIILTGVSAEQHEKLKKAIVVSSNIEGVTVGEKILYSKMFGTTFENYVILDETDAFVVEE